MLCHRDAIQILLSPRRNEKRLNAIKYVCAQTKRPTDDLEVLKTIRKRNIYIYLFLSFFYLRITLETSARDFGRFSTPRVQRNDLVRNRY